MDNSKNSESWVSRARDAYTQSTSYVDSNYRKQWEEDLSHFNSDHAPGSKYHSDSYKYRSKVFRPKTRASIRSNEAAAVAAFFSNQDVVSIEAANQSDQVQRISAEVWQEVLNYRLQKTIPWFQLCIGGFQDAQTVGVVCSRQEWKYEEKQEQYEQQYINELGEVETETVTETVTETDEPCITLLPVENLRIHPGASWIDPINDSPYIIELMPMLVGEVKQRMKTDVYGEGKWKKLDDKDFHDGLDQSDDSTRHVRTDREDQYEEDYRELSDFDTVWVHRNIMQINGEDILYYTLGTSHLLSDPVKLEEVSKIGRNYVLGCCVLETHKQYPGGVSRLGAQVQKEINEIANQRADNVKLVLNKRWLVRRGADIDVQSIMRNVPGSTTYVNDINQDVGELNWPDVTSSSYAEQDRLNMDYDEVTGTFSTGSINTNRNLGETVGGMSMLRGASNIQTEYLLRTFAETWVEPVLRQLMQLEQAYETDLTILNWAADKAQLVQKYGVDQLTDQILDQELSVTVNVGMGSTDPVTRLERFVLAMNQYMQMAAASIQLGQAAPNMEEVAKEIFGKLGYKDGSRFFPDDQMKQVHAQYEQVIQQLQQQLNTQQQEFQAKMMIEQAKLEDADLDRQLKAQIESAKLGQDIQTGTQAEKTKLIKTQMDNDAAMERERLKSVTQLLNKTAGETNARNQNVLSRS